MPKRKKVFHKTFQLSFQSGSKLTKCVANYATKKNQNNVKRFPKQFHRHYSKVIPTWTDVHWNISHKEMSKHWKGEAVPLFELPITAPLFSRARSIFCFLDRRGGEEEGYISLSGIPFNVLLCLSKVDEEKMNCTKRSLIGMFWWKCCCSINLN